MRKTRSLANSNQMEEAQVVPPFHTSYYYNYIVATGRTDDKPTVCYRRQWNPCHMDFGLVFQQAIDRQDRILQTEGRFSLLEPLETQPSQDSLPTTGQGLIARRRDDMPCRTTPLRLLRLLQPERRDHLANRHHRRLLRIAHPLDTNTYPLTPTTSVQHTPLS